jgi:hypothetical protein
MTFFRAARLSATSGERVCVRGKVYAVIIWFELYKHGGESQPRKIRADLLGDEKSSTWYTLGNLVLVQEKTQTGE